MPEGHKTHFLAREHTQWFAGQVLKVTSPQGRFRGDARKVSGRVFDRCEAVGKHLFYHFDCDAIVHIHLGRYGKYRVHAAPPPPPVGLVRMRMIGLNQCLDLNGPTTCRVIDSQTRDETISKLGPDPLADGDASAKRSTVWQTIHASGKPIGALILDQSVIAGVGNIFRAEVFFELGLDPRIPGNHLDRQTFDQLWKSLLKMMRTGLRYGKIITVSRQEAGVPLQTLEDAKRFRIYGKEHCPCCGGPIETIPIAARKLYWCPACQGSAS